MSEWVRPPEDFNGDHHDFTNEQSWPVSRLQARLDELKANERAINYTGERKAQVSREIGAIAFELSCRYAEETNQEWENHNAN